MLAHSQQAAQMRTARPPGARPPGAWVPPLAMAAAMMYYSMQRLA